MKKVKRLLTLFMVYVLLLTSASCSNGITAEQYNEACTERDKLQMELQRLQESQPSVEQYNEVCAERDELQTQLQRLQESRPSVEQYNGACAEIDKLRAQLQSLQENQLTEEQYKKVCAERDALRTQLQEMQNNVPEKETELITVKISGGFTATVRGLIPDYVLDGWTPREAIVTEFMSDPYTLYVGDLAQQLEIEETYVFEIEPEIVQVSESELKRINICDPKTVIYFRLTISNVRIAGDDEIGLASKSLTYERVQEEP